MSDSELEQLKAELQQLADKIKVSQEEAKDACLIDICKSMPDVQKVTLRTKKVLKGHISKVNSVHFSGDDRNVVSGALDGKLIIWDTWTGNKVLIIPLLSSWVMAVAFSKSGKFVACGGMDNICTVYGLSNGEKSGTSKMCRELMGMEGFLSCCRFLDDSTLITGSADTKVSKWDLQKGVRIHDFNGHSGDVITMSLAPDGNTFLTGSVDKSIKLWDVRDGSCKQTFWGHESDVNSVCYHSSGFYFGTCSDDKTTRMFDVRADQQIGQYVSPTSDSGFTACGLSKSGRLIIGGSDDSKVHIWDTLTAKYNDALHGHSSRITSLSMPDSGMAVVTSSWDTTVRVWN